MNNIHPSMFSYFLSVVFLIFVWRGERGGSIMGGFEPKENFVPKTF